MSFVAPRERVDFDPEALLAAIPDQIQIKRIFLDIALSSLGDRDASEQLLAELGIDLDGIGEFEDVRWHDYFRVMLRVAERTHGPEQLSVGLRAIGRRFYPALIRTPVGKLMLGRQLGDGIRNAADAWAHFNTLGRVWAEHTSERSFDYHFENFPRALAETVIIGVFEGMFRYHHMPPTITIADDGPDQTILRISW